MPDQVVADVPRDQVELDETLSLNAEVDDANYEEINTSQVSAWITDPDEELIEVPMDWTADRDGEYASNFTPRKEGLYEVRIEATTDGELLGSDTAYFRVTAERLGVLRLDDASAAARAGRRGGPVAGSTPATPLTRSSTTSRRSGAA